MQDYMCCYPDSSAVISKKAFFSLIKILDEIDWATYERKGESLWIEFEDEYSAWLKFMLIIFKHI